MEETSTYFPYPEGQPLHERYIWWVQQELNNSNEESASYASSLLTEYEKLKNNQITIEEFEINIPYLNVSFFTPLNYLRDCIIKYFDI
jgi:hypothetical protein